MIRALTYITGRFCEARASVHRRKARVWAERAGKIFRRLGVIE